MNRRQLVQILMAVNAVGAMIFSALLAEVVLEHRTPWFGIAGVCVMFAGIAVPFHREFISIRRSFSHLERDALEGIRHRRGDRDYMELIGTVAKPSPFRKVHDQPLVAIFLTLLGWGLVGAEFVLWTINHRP